ncbi:hypothetical protein [Paenibacillus sp. WLX2291]|uniref:hypothetical protein n=1 Tax=Paenibacillus sp. WLX2291 TaxID=3296934 RepID=UPI003984002C
MMNKYQFIWCEGVLGYGGLTSLGVMAMHYMDHTFVLTLHGIWNEVSRTVPLFLLCGYLLGEMIWRWKSARSEAEKP